MAKKRKKKTVLKKAMESCGEAWKLYCKTRDGNKCRVCGSFLILQVDHCFSRKNSKLFFDPRNGTTLCRRCHSQKTWKTNGFDRLVDRIVKQREGLAWWQEAEDAYLSLKPHVWDIFQVEQQEFKLKQMTAELLQKE